MSSILNVVLSLVGEQPSVQSGSSRIVQHECTALQSCKKVKICFISCSSGSSGITKRVEIAGSRNQKSLRPQYLYIHGDSEIDTLYKCNFI